MLLTQSSGDSVREESKGDSGHDDHDEDLAKEQDKVSHLVKNSSSGSILGQQDETLASSTAEVVTVDGGHNVGVPVDEPDELLQAPETALAAAHDALDQRVLRAVLLDLVLNILQSYTNHPHE